MNVKDAIESRHSIRKFLPKEIPERIITEILEAGRLAPSACNGQPTRFVLIKPKDLMDACLKEKVFAQNWVYKAPLVIVYCADKKESLQARSGLLERMQKPAYFKQGKDWTEIDVSISSAFTALRATELGLGSCYVGLIDEAKARKTLKIPEACEVLFALVLGYPDEKPDGRHERKPLKEFILKSE